MNTDGWTPMLRARHWAYRKRRSGIERWDRARYLACKRTKSHVTDGWCRRCGTLTIHVHTSAPEETK